MRKKYNLPTVVYCATREKDLLELEKSVQTVREFYQDIEIILVTTFQEYQNKSINCIQILKSPHNNFLDKIAAIIEVKRREILFLDGDTFIINKIDDLFLLLDCFDLAVAHAPNRWTYKIPEVPDAFPEFNTGVLLLKKTFRMKRFLKKWFKNYESDLKKKIDYPSKDQIGFRKTLLFSKIRYATLTPEYNCRFSMGAMVSHNVKILHGRTNSFQVLKEGINAGAKNKWSGELNVRWIKY